MKIPSLLYLCFWALVSVLALTSVDILLNKVDQFSSHSADLVQILHAFLYFSLFRVFVCNPSLNWPPGRVSGSAQLQQSYLSTVSINFFHWYACAIFIALDSIIYRYVDHTVKIEYNKLVLPLYVACFLSSYHSELQSFVTIKVPLSTKIIVGLIGHILANHYLKDKSFILFWLVVSLAIFWLGNIAMMQSSFQPGIFEFLVGAILDIAGELFGLNIYMWLVGFGCAVLFIFFEHLDKFNLQYPGGGGADDHGRTRIEAPSRGHEPVLSYLYSWDMLITLIMHVSILLVVINLYKSNLPPPEFGIFYQSVLILLLLPVMMPIMMPITTWILQYFLGIFDRPTGWFCLDLQINWINKRSNSSSDCGLSINTSLSGRIEGSSRGRELGKMLKLV